MKRKTFLKFGIYLNILIICTILHRIPLFSVISVGVWVLFMIDIVKNDKKFVLRYLYYVYISSAVIASLVMCEFTSGYYLSEINSNTKFVGSLPLLILGQFIFLRSLEFGKAEKVALGPVLSSEIGDNGFNSKNNKAIKVLRYINMIVLVLFAYLFFSIITRPAFLLNTDRTFYFSLYAPQNKLFSLIRGQSSVMVSIPLLLLIFDKGKKVLPVTSVILYSMFHLWVGNKFTPFISVACIFFMLYSSDLNTVKAYKIKKVMKGGIAFMGFAVFMAVIIQSQLSNLNRSNYAITRFSQQGQLWWKTYDLTEEMHPKEFLNEIDNLFSGREDIQDYVDSNVGIYKIMYLCGPKSLVDHRLSIGTRYTEGGYACAYVYFGIVGVVLFALFNAFCVFHLVKGIFSAVANTDYIKFIILIRLLLRFNAFIPMFTLGELIDIGCIVSYIYLLVFHNSKIVISGKGIKLQKYKS